MKDHTYIWRPYIGRPSWPSLLLASVVVILWFAVVGCNLAGQLSLWAAIVANTLLAYLAFTPMHEAMHGNISAGRPAWGRVESIAGWFCGAMLGGPYLAFKHSHLAHHSHTNQPNLDPGLWAKSHSFFSIILRCLTTLPRAYALFFVSPDWRGKWYRVGLTQLLGVGLLALAFHQGALSQILLLWILPGGLAISFLAFVLDWVPHHPHEETDRYRVARIIDDPKMHWIMMGHSYHLVHHLWPNIPFHYYRKVFQKARNHLLENGASITGPDSFERTPQA